MRGAVGVPYWIVVGALTMVGIYASVLGNLPPFFLLVALAMAVLGAWWPGWRYSWAALVGLGGLPALVFFLNIVEGIRSALNPYCNPDPEGKIKAPKGVVVECSEIPTSYYVLFAIFAGIALVGVVAVGFLLHAPPRPDARVARLSAISGPIGVGLILVVVVGGIAFRIMEGMAPPPPPERAGLPPNGLPVSCSEGEEDIGVFNGVGDRTIPKIEMIGEGWRYAYNSVGSGAFSIEALDKDGNTVPSSTVEGVAGDEGRSPRIQTRGTFSLKIVADEEVGHTVLLCDETDPSGKNKGSIRIESGAEPP